MELRNWIWTENDQVLAEKWMDSLPDRIIDVHAHIYRLQDLGKQSTPYIDGPEIAGHDTWNACVERFIGAGKDISAIHVAPPCETSKEIEASNAFTLEEVKKNPDCKALVLISPEMGRDRVEEYLKTPSVVGMKPFSYYARYDGPSSQAPLETYLPEWAWQCAHDHGLMFLVHLMRPGAQADPCCLGTQGLTSLDVLQGFLREETADARAYLVFSRCAPNGEARRVLRAIAAEETEHRRQLQAVIYLITGKPYRAELCAPPVAMNGYCAALRARYHEEVCGGFNYGRAAEETNDFCLRKLFSRLSADEYRHAELLRKLLAGALP